jgi:RNA polymerase primary sigma factor
MLNYLKETSNNDLLTKEEEVNLAIQINGGNKYALDKLINSNLRFVIHIAKQYQNQGLPLEDLISEGNYGAIIAAKKFDYTRGYRFISYAVWWIRQSITQALNETSRTIRIPSNIIVENQKRKKIIDNPLIDTPYTMSYNQKVNENNEFLGLLEDCNSISPDQKMISEDKLKSCIRKCDVILDEREKDIIFKYYGLEGEEWTLDAIGEKYSLTRERIRQLKEKTIKKLQLNYLDFQE